MVESSALEPLETTDSAYAGAFFLINVAIDLGLYSHGVTIVEESELSIWRFVEVVSRRLLVDPDPDDPLWTLLLGFAPPQDDPTSPNGWPDLSTEVCDGLVARVQERLGEQFPGVDDPAGLLIRQRGRIVRTPGHFAVRFALERHPVEIRAARLDRNPGWIPAAGVHIGFHFD